MPTKRETILTTIATAVSSAAPVGVSVSRNRLDAYSREEGSATIVIRPVNDVKANESLGLVSSRMTFAVDIISVLTQSAIDDIAQAIYAAVMASNHGAQDITPLNHSWEMEQGDANTIILVMEFEILYRHNWESLS